MSKKMTPCEKLGYKVGDKFEVIGHYAFKKGQVVTLHEDDGTKCPLFAGDGGGAGVFDGVECSFATLNKQVRKIANKLKPAKQALADAIHQNGGWPESELLDFATSNAFGEVLCSASHPERKGNVWVNGDYYRLISCIKGTIANWHQTVLSRDEYFTAYPEQLKVDINNETKHKVEAEMTSESEMTINVSSAGAVAGGDWHKNGELPPVGEVCKAYIDYPPQWIETEIVAHKDGFAIGWCKSVMKGCHGDKAHEFRPLRTERDRAIDEMMEHCNYLVGRDFAGELFDAGYRREAK